MAINFPDPSQQTTYVADSGVTYEFIDGVWKATTFAGLGDVRYVNSTGDDMTGNLTIATDKILLNTDGRAEFAGAVSSNSSFRSSLTDNSSDQFYWNQAQHEGAALGPGYLTVGRKGDSGLIVNWITKPDDGSYTEIMSRWVVDGGTDVISFTKDGSAEFTGTVNANALTVNGAAVDTSAQVDAKIAALETSLTDGAPGALDTLNELAASLSDDSNFAGTVTNSLAGKADLSGATFTGDVTASAFIGDGSQLTGVGSETIISSTPPTPADYEVGTMWWNSDSTDTSLYILYQDPTGPNGDAGGKYWIEAAPAPDSIGFDGTHTGDSTFTGNMNVTGTGTFAGGIDADYIIGVSPDARRAGVNPLSDTGPFYFVGTDGNVKFKVAQSGGIAISNVNTETDPKISLSSDGSATFAGDVDSPRVNLKGTSTENILAGYAGNAVNSLLTADAKVYLGNISGGGNIVLDGTDGSATFAGQVQSNKNDGWSFEANATFQSGMGAYRSRANNTGSSNIYHFYATSSDNKEVVIRADGSATFAGVVVGQSRISSIRTDLEAGYSNNTISFNTTSNHTGSTKAYSYIATRIPNGGSAEVVSALRTDGSATFAGDVVRGTYAANSNYCALRDGQLEIGRNTNDGNLTLIKGTRYNGATTYDTFNFKADGSATFAGSIGAAAVALNSFLVIDNPSSTGTNNFIRCDSGIGDNRFVVKLDGSATFAGNVNIGSSYSEVITVAGTGINAPSQLVINGAINNGTNPPAFTVRRWQDLNGTGGGPTVATINYDGSTTFAGNNRTAGTSFISKTTNGYRHNLISTGYFINNDANNVSTVALNADGSATFGSPGYGDGAIGTWIIGNGLYNSSGIQVFNQSTNSNYAMCYSAYGVGANNRVSWIGNTGAAYFAGNITAGNVSDIKFKENIEAAPAQLADIEEFELKTFDWKDEAPISDELKAQRKLGLIAQEVEAICPEMVYEVPGQDDDSYKAINHDVLIMKLLGAVKELAAKVAALEAS